MPPAAATAHAPAFAHAPAPRDSGPSYSSISQNHYRQSHGHTLQPAGQTNQDILPPQQDCSGRLVYADPRSLPSYPIIGLKDGNAHSIAANLAIASGRPTSSHTSTVTTNSTTTAAFTTTTQPGNRSANPASLKAATAAAAASLAAPLPPPAPQYPVGSATSAVSPPATAEPPTANLESSHTAATMAVGSSANRLSLRHTSRAPNSSTASAKHIVQSPDTSSWGNSAASQAFKASQDTAAAHRASLGAVQVPKHATSAVLKTHPSMHAADGAMRAASNRSSRSQGLSGHRSHDRASIASTTFRHRRSQSSHFPESTTEPQATAPTTSANALSAATLAARGAVPYTTMSRDMFTSRPPVGPEVDEQSHADGLHASAMAMAKRMYNPKVDRAVPGEDALGESTHTTNLQEAAYKLAQERLEKLHLEHEQGREFRDHYIDPNLEPLASPSGEPARRFNSIRGLLRRRRSSSDSEVTGDRRRSLEIRHQMSALHNRISEVDYEKRRKDRQAVLIVAQRNAQAQLREIDEHVFAGTGRVHPTLRSSWESKAHATAQARVTARLSQGPGPGQVAIGGGKFMDQAEVDKIATRRVQPILDEINDKAEKEHERQAALKEEEEERKREAAIRKANEREAKEFHKKLKQEDKAAKKQEKAAAKEAKAHRGVDVTGDGDAVEGSNEIDTETAERGLAAEAGRPAGPHEDSEPQEQQHTAQTLTFGHTTPRRRRTNSVGGGSRLSMLFARTPKLSIGGVRKRDEPPTPTTSRGSRIGPPGAADVPGATTVPGAGDAVGASGAIVAAGAMEAAGTGAPARSSPETGRRPVATNKQATPPLSPPSENDSSANASPSSRIKGWLKSRFARPRSKSSASASGTSLGTTTTSGPLSEQSNTERSFVGGHALTSTEYGTARNSLVLASVPLPAEGSGWNRGDRAATDVSDDSHTPPAAAMADTSRFADELDVLPTHETSTAQIVASGVAGEEVTTDAVPPLSGPVVEDDRSGPALAARRPVTDRRDSVSSISTYSTGPEEPKLFGGRLADVEGEAEGTVVSSVAATATATATNSAAASETGDTGTDDGPIRPPRTLHDPAQRKTPSPMRDSRFHENLGGNV